jgi:hypothetical protein
VVSFKPRPLNLPLKSLRYPLYRRLAGPQSPSGLEEVIIVDLTGPSQSLSLLRGLASFLFILQTMQARVLELGDGFA